MTVARTIGVLVLCLAIPVVSLAAERDLGFALSVHCVDCHGNDGYSDRPGIPNLAAQKEPYMALQLRRFRQIFVDMFGDSKTYDPSKAPRDHPVMNHQAGLLSDAAIDSLSIYYAGLRCKNPSSPQPLPKPKAAEPCADCHGGKGVSQSPTIPNLARQNADYLIIQLKAFRKSTLPVDTTFTFPNRNHPAMGNLVRKFTNADLRALAEYFDWLPCP